MELKAGDLVKLGLAELYVASGVIRYGDLGIVIIPWQFDTNSRLEWITIYWFHCGKKIKSSSWLKSHLEKISGEKENEDV